MLSLSPTDFIAHNIRLPDGSLTMQGQPLAESSLCTSVVRSLNLFCPIGGGRQPRVADLGCLEGGYALAIAQAGYETLGIEGRQANVDKCNYLASLFQLPNLSFVRDDVRNLASYGRFDAISAAGSSVTWISPSGS